MTLEELVSGSEAKVVSQFERTFSGVGTDTRADLNGKIFVALKGDTFDAHDFLDKAVAAGATALLVHRLPENAKGLGDKVTIVQVDDTLRGLQRLGNFWRRKLGRETGVKILGVTGTNGKTTTKEFAAAVLGAKFDVQWSRGSFNNHWGVPISLLSIDSGHQVAVIEMGMNHPGELTELVAIAEPDAVLVTMVGRGHLEGVGSIEGVARAKAEIYEHASREATRIFNLDNEHTRAMLETWGKGRAPGKVLTFASPAWAKKAGQALDVSLEIASQSFDSLVVRGEIRGTTGEATVTVFGSHNVTNLMAAASLALVCGMTPQEIWKALPLCKMAWGRNQWVNLASGARALFDAYNANPESMSAAVDNFAALAPKTGGRKMAILGEMRELGEQSPALHRELGERVARAGFDAVAFIGPHHADFEAGLNTAGFSKKLFVSDSYEKSLAPRMLPVLDREDIVLIKGSRGMQLEKALKDLKPLDFEEKK